jgi:hypothetical protein
LTLELAAHTVVAAHAIPGIQAPVGIAIKGSDLYIINAAGDILVVEHTLGVNQ